MHEMSLAENVVSIVDAAAKAEGSTRVIAIWLEIGALSCVAPDALRFCFDAIARGTVAEGARIEIITVPGEGTCGSCAKSAIMTALYDLCPHCGQPGLQPNRGTEMRVKEIEIDSRPFQNCRNGP